MYLLQYRYPDGPLPRISIALRFIETTASVWRVPERFYIRAYWFDLQV